MTGHSRYQMYVFYASNYLRTKKIKIKKIKKPAYYSRGNYTSYTNYQLCTTMISLYKISILKLLKDIVHLLQEISSRF